MFTTHHGQCSICKRKLFGFPKEIIIGKLTSRYAVVTGAGKGIGRAIAERYLADDVAGVALFDIDLELVSNTAKELDPTGEKVIAICCNVADQESVRESFKAVLEKFDRVDIPVNNAGITRDAMFQKMSESQACHDSSCVTGNCILVCCGMKMRG